MGAYNENTLSESEIRGRLNELARIRQGFATHLGSSLYEITKDNDDFRWGRESLYDGIAACDAERKRLLELMKHDEPASPSEVPAPMEEAREEPQEVAQVESQEVAQVEPQEVAQEVAQELTGEDTPDDTLSDDVPAAMTCPVCGCPTDPSYRFCMECGAKLK